MKFERFPIEKQEAAPEEIRMLFRGVWADELFGGQELPVGGSLYSEQLTGRLQLDFESFEDELGNYTEEGMKDFFESNGNNDKYREYIESFNSDFDPYLHFVCYQIQNKIISLLEIDQIKRTNALERTKMYVDNVPKLSEMKGKTMCGERAALAQYLLQKIGVESAYVSGVSSFDEAGEMEEGHSFIVLKDKDGQTFIFDVARPHEGNNVPSIFKTDEHFDYELLAGKEDLLVGGTEVLVGQRAYFGVGDPNVL
ncbi:MAG TPA: hypothetical protein P5328_00075 [Candidatus Paceibacterota bacterium]|nr:hypothetical protein [Candidatus Paceibacterota bacterium]HRZ34273.1 hypothetical protein [Candidatus Paceibacterota bacterium]